MDSAANNNEIDQTIERLLRVVLELGRELNLNQSILSEIDLDSSFERDLGLDSLTRVELLSRVEERFNVTLGEKILAEIETIRDLLKAIVNAKSSKGMGPIPMGELARLNLGSRGNIALDAKTLVQVIEDRGKAHPERPHIILYQDQGQADMTINYGMLWEGAVKVAAGLQGSGVMRGDTVAIMLPTSAEYFYSFLGILLAGAIPVPIYPPARILQLKEHLLRHRAILNNAAITALITTEEAKPVARLLESQVTSLTQVLTLKELYHQPKECYQPVVAKPEDIAFLQYTSGSTGNPKGVVLTHANLLANINAIGKALRIKGDRDVVVSWLPLYHDMGLIGVWLTCMFFMAPVVIMSPLAFLSRPSRWLWAIHRYRATLTTAPNFAYELCLKRIGAEDLEGLDLSSLRAALNGAEPVSPSTIGRFYERFAKYGYREAMMLPVYGLAESSVALAFTPLESSPLIETIERDTFMQRHVAIPCDPQANNPLAFVACGTPIVGHQVRIVDAAGYEVADRIEGRLQFSGPSATSGYYKNSAATKSLVKGAWLESGDLAYISNGNIFITGRIKDIIIHGGRNIYPHEIEEAAGNIEGIRKGCVAVFASKKAGTEKMVVVAETKVEDQSQRERLYREINAVAVDLVGMAADDIVLVPPHRVLKTSSGKIRRQACLELYEKGTIGKSQRTLWLEMLLLGMKATFLSGKTKFISFLADVYSCYAWSMVVLFTPPIWLIGALLPRALGKWPLMRALLIALTFLIRIRTKLRGMKNLPDPKHPCIYVANHSSYLDGFALVAGFERPLRFIAKGELQQNPFMRIFLKGIGAHFVERFNIEQGLKDTEAIKDYASNQDGGALLFFPEGTFTRIPGIYPFHMGAFLTAVDVGAAIVPLAISGTRKVLHPDSWRLRPGSILISAAKPIDPQESQNQKRWEAARFLAKNARHAILSLSGEVDLKDEKSPVFDLAPR